MAIKLDTNMSAVAHHIVDGPVTFPYAVDAQSAISRFPNEWSETPWSAADVAAARKDSGQPDLVLTPEEQAALDEHAKAVAEANERLAARRAKLEAERQEAEQAAQDEAIVKSAPPLPDPNAPRRPFGRKGEPTPAELEQIRKREAKKAADDKLAADKAAADAQANPQAKITQ